VSEWPIPQHPGKDQEQRPQTSDEFSGAKLGPQWEWNHNPVDAGWSLTERRGFLRLKPEYAGDIFSARNTLTEMMQDDAFEFTTRVDLAGMKDGDHAGLAMFEQAASGVQVMQAGRVRSLGFFHGSERVDGAAQVAGGVVLLRVRVDGDTASYSYSVDEGKTFASVGPTVGLKFSWWKGSRPALFAYATEHDADAGHVDFDWAHYVRVEASVGK
jgi:beta-xylosidase